MKKLILGLALLLPIMASSSVLANDLNNKKEIITIEAPLPIGAYSQAIQTGNTVYISGQIPKDPKTGEIVQGDFNDQVEQALKNVSAITKAAGGNVDNIVKLTVYLSDLDNFSLVNKAVEKYFHKPFPARAALEIKALPKLASVEIEAVMVL